MPVISSNNLITIYRCRKVFVIQIIVKIKPNNKALHQIAVFLKLIKKYIRVLHQELKSWLWLYEKFTKVAIVNVH